MSRDGDAGGSALQGVSMSLDDGEALRSEDIEMVIVPRTRDLGDGFNVRRALPAARRQMVGPFIFLDQLGPAVLEAGRGLDVRPHPHIGLATVTYLFEGTILHRDSIGSVQSIEPGAVNWMTAGHGIVHSERSPTEERSSGKRLFGIQTWVALPREHEEAEPSFNHFPASALPTLSERGMSVRLIAGTLMGLRSPVPTYSAMFYVDVRLEAGADLQLKDEFAERAAYIVEGSVEVGRVALGSGNLPVFARTGDVLIRATAPSRVLLFGGEPMDGPRHIVWNFVSSRADRISEAKEQWKTRRFPAVPNETDFIPLPGGLPVPVDYP
jgi:redox-sensitive bicupin YhaK (pirin superfamily)